MKKNPKTILGLIVLGVLLVALGLLAINTVHIAGRVAYEKSLTPTPLPPFGNVMAVTPDPNAPTPEPLLRNGSVGEEVKNVQSRLKNLGYYSGEIDGQYGSGTREAVYVFQQRNGLMADGIVGSETKEILFSVNASPYINENLKKEVP